MIASLDLALGVADHGRRAVLARLGSAGPALITGRDLRVAVGGTALAIVSLVLTIVAPLWLLALGPVVLGVPHLVADVRYLVVRPGWHRRVDYLVLVALPLAVCAVMGDLLAGFLASAGALFVARGSGTRTLAAAAAVALMLGSALALAGTAEIVFAHAHDAIAVLLWVVWRRRDRGLYVWPLAAFSAGLLVLASGAPLPWMARHGALESGPGIDVGPHLAALAPGLAPDPALRLVLCFAFAQSVHYLIWLRLIPEDDRPRPTPRSFRASLRALRADFGDVPLVACGLAAAAIVAWSVFDLAAARHGYLRLAYFHGHLELAAVTLWFVQGRSAGGSRAE